MIIIIYTIVLILAGYNIEISDKQKEVKRGMPFYRSISMYENKENSSETIRIGRTLLKIK